MENIKFNTVAFINILGTDMKVDGQIHVQVALPHRNDSTVPD